MSTKEQEAQQAQTIAEAKERIQWAARFLGVVDEETTDSKEVAR